MKGRTVVLVLICTASVAFTAAQETLWEDAKTNWTESTQHVDGVNEAQDDSNSSAMHNETRVTYVGIKNHHPLCIAGNDDEEGKIGCMVGNNILNTLEMDSKVTVTAIEMGELVCDGLGDSEEAEYLQLGITSSQVVLAKRKSMRTEPASLFEDNKARKIWHGEVVEDDGTVGIPRSVSMTWTDCDPETYLLKLITPTGDGSTLATLSIPCEETEGVKDLCIVEVMREDIDESDEDLVTNTIPDRDDSSSSSGSPPQRYLRASGESQSSTASPATVPASVNERPLSSNASTRGNLGVRRRLQEVVREGINAARAEDPQLDAKDRDLRLLNDYLDASPQEQEAFHAQGIRRLSPVEVKMPSGRVLSISNVIDVLVLYTTKAMYESNDLQGSIRSRTQMETDIITAYAGANDALADSGIDVSLRVVHMERVDDIDSGDITDSIYDLYKGTDKAAGVPELRDQYGADLVQLLGFYEDTCGIGFTMETPTAAFARYGYSIVHTNCITNFSHIHEIGHNMGANHNKENTKASHEYAYAQRYCSGSIPYRTIMAYEEDCRSAPRVNVFSNPDIAYAGRAQGTDTSNNARAIRESMVVVSNFRDNIISSPTPTPSASTSTQRSSTASQSQKSGNSELNEATPSPSFPPVPIQGRTPMPFSSPTIPPTMLKPSQKPTPAPYSRAATSTVAPSPKPSASLTPSPAPTSASGGESGELGSIYPEKVPGKQMKRRGCWADDPSDRVMEAGTEMPAIPGTTIGMKRENCLAYCYNKRNEYTYFGVEYGYECFCWGNNKDYKRLGKLDNEECGMPCEGDEDSTCGGAFALEIFKIKHLESDEDVAMSVYQGCFRDTLLDFGMSNQPVVDYEYTTHAGCRQHCDATGFTYFSLQYGYLCTCGNSVPSEEMRSDDDNCRLHCSSPNDDMDCGGSWHKAVYTVKNLMEDIQDNDSEDMESENPSDD